MTDQNGTSHPSTSAGLDPRKDPAVFRPDGTIVFLRSDGDPSYAAPNTIKPPASAVEVNYFHIMAPGEGKYERWSSIIGADLAAWAGQPSKPPQGKEWKLASYPADYQMSEQRKGPKGSYRTDQYLYGSAGHRFRSTKEFLPHAQWLIMNDGSSCQCRYCPGGRPRGSGGGGGSNDSPKEKRERPVRVGRPPAPNKKLAPTNSYKVKTQDLPRPQDRPSLGVTVPSIPLRDVEMARTAAAAKGECEGFRIGEIVWAVLEPPLQDPTDSKRVIDKWPAHVEDVKTISNVAPVPPKPAAPSDPRRAKAKEGQQSDAAENGTFSLEGRVKQERQYDIILVGTPEDRGRVPESRLMPFLVGFVTEEVKRSPFGKMAEHTWFSDANGFPSKLHLLEPPPSESARPSYSKVAGALAFSLTSCAYLRSRYRVTDPFQLPEGVAADAERESALLDVPNGQASAAALAETVNPADTEIRASLADRQGRGDDRPSRVFRSAKNTVYKGGIYYQGVFAGLERIWVGDVVRLRLRDKEVKDMMEALVADKRLARKSDAGEGADTKGTYIMRVRAITKEGSRVQVAGSVYQVMTQAEFDAKKAIEKALFDAVPPKNDDVFGFEKQFAFPALGLLSANGQELPASPPISDEFVLSRVNAESREVVFDMTKVAGRLYPSLAKLGDPEQIYSMKEVQKLVFSKYQDTMDANFARLSLTGALPGLVKAMNVELWEQRSGAELMRSCFDAARGEIYRHIKHLLEGPSAGSEGSKDALTQQASDDITAVAAAAAAAATGSGGEASASNGANKRKSAGDDASSTPWGPQSKRAATQPGNTPVRGGAAGAAGSTTTTPTIRVVAATASPAPSGTPTTAKPARPPAVVEDPTLPPLRAGWIVQSSRNGHGVYYAHPATKTTTWERPV